MANAIVSMLRSKKNKGKDRDRSSSKMPADKAENSNLLRKPKNDDSSESSSIKDSGYEEAEIDRISQSKKGNIKSKGISDSGKKFSRDAGSLRNIKRKNTGRDEPPPITNDLPEASYPIFNLKEINSIWASDDDDDIEEKEKTSLKNNSDIENLEDDLIGVRSSLSARTTIIQ